MEANGQNASPGVNKTTLGDICDQVGTWPHGALKESLEEGYMDLPLTILESGMEALLRV
jgi:hypothetical protein